MPENPPRRRARRSGLVSLVAVAAATALSFAGAGAAHADALTPYPGSVPAWATAAADQGAAAADTSVEGEIYLQLSNQAGAERIAAQVSTPGSANYRKPLTPTQWIARYAPTKAALDQVTSYLTSRGLTVTAVPDSRLFVVFRGTAEQVGSVFHTAIHTYAHKGESLAAPSSAPSVPSSLAGSVTGIGLDQAKLLTRPDSVRPDAPDAAAAGALQRKAAAASPIDTPCSQYANQYTAKVPPAYNGKTRYGTYLCGYTPAQIRSAYGIQSLTDSGVTGAGQTVAITDAYASPTIVKDVNTYSKSLGEPTLKKGQYTQIVPTPDQFVDKEACSFPSGWQGEQTLDVEAVHAVAPGANILYVGGFNCGGGLDVAVSKILDGRLADIVTNSWGNTGEDLPLNVLEGQSHQYLQAAAEGIGMYFSSGDNGDQAAAVGQPEPDFPASSPWVTSVGGTSLGIDKNGAIAWETGWGDTRDQILKDATTGKLSYKEPLPGTEFRFGAGGGPSTLFAQPAYQRGIVPAALAKGKRVSPDIASLADPYTGFLIGIRSIVDDDTLATGPFETYGIGGTSLASPLSAAQVALVQQRTGVSFGFANPTLYSLRTQLPSLFRDVVPSNPPQALAFTSPATGLSFLITMDRDTSLVTTPGYDDVTGLGNLSFSILSRAAQMR